MAAIPVLLTPCRPCRERKTLADVTQNIDGSIATFVK